MQLKQKDYPNLEPQDLPSNDDIVDTGPMGGCSSVIFLWEPGKEGNYANVRGYHGGGGLQAVNWRAMRSGVTNNSSTRVYVFASPENTTDHERKLTNKHLREEVLAFLPLVYCKTYQGVAQAKVNRKGEVELVSFTKF